jgi:hypothetical protein
MARSKRSDTIQAAVDAVASTGGSVFIPAGTYSATSVPAFTGVSIPDSVHVRGAGHGATIMLRNTGTRVYVGSVYIAPGAAVAVPADEAAFMLEHFKADAYGRGPFEIVED